MLIKKSVLLIVSFVALSCQVIAQLNIGTPGIKNFTNADYNAASEIWDIKQYNNGILYFANNDGLLSFDGSYWKVYQMPNKAAIKSIAIDPSGRIYCGGQDELGYFFPDKNGILKFNSLKNLLPQKARQFADIWNIVLFNNEVFFRTKECIFQLKDNKLNTFDAPGGWRLLSKANSQLYAEDKDSGLMVFKDGLWQGCFGSLHTADLQITGIVDYKKDTLLVTTLKKGLFLMTGSSIRKKTTAIDYILNKDLVTYTKKIDDDRYAIGSATKGLFIIDGKGNLVERLSITEGLQNNNIHNVLIDHDKNLWIGLENGIDFVNYNSAVKHIYIDKENQLKSTAAIVFDKKLFIGTSNGLYSIPLGRQTDISKSNGIFTEIENTKGQVYSLSQIDNNLALAHHDGAMLLRDNRAEFITTGQGAWMFKPIPDSGDIIISTYTGLQLLNNVNGNFTSTGKITGIYESLSTIVNDNNNTIWASHPNRGIYKIQLSPDRKKIVAYTQFTEKRGLPSILNNRVYLIKNKIIAGTEKGVYEYSSEENRFVRSTYFNPIFGEDVIKYLTEDKGGNLWFISNKRIGVVDFSKPLANKLYNVVYFPELAGQKVKGASFIYPYNAENIFVGSANGVFNLNYKQYVSTEHNKLNALLTTVKTIAEKDSIIFGGYFVKDNKLIDVQSTKHIPTVTNHWNSFHFEYSSTLFSQKSNEEFTYKLIGFDNEWSKWSAKTEKDYTNLPYGIYTFSVKARNNPGNESEPVNYTFKVKPASYQTPWAYFFYTLMITCAIFGAARAQHKKFKDHQKKHEDEQKRLQYLHCLELDRSEKEIIALKNDNLETEINYKNKELATLTMHLVDRGHLLLNIKDELMVLTKKLNIPDPAYQFRSIFKLLSDADKNDDDWNQFAMYFDQVHNNFLSTMKTKFPGLSSTDLKLCAYLRLNLTSKEIAQLLNISLKGVEVSRYRVRKKLNLCTEVHLYDFLMQITK